MLFSPSVASRQLPRQRELGFASAYFAVQAILPSRQSIIYLNFSIIASATRMPSTAADVIPPA